MRLCWIVVEPNQVPIQINRRYLELVIGTGAEGVGDEIKQLYTRVWGETGFADPYLRYATGRGPLVENR